METSAGWDVAVIGSGPAGEGAAMRAAKSGLRVALVERQPLLGGSCTHLATIPSKALRHQVRQVIRQRENPLLHAMSGLPDLGWPDLVHRIEDVIRAQASVRSGFYFRNRVRVFTGEASLVSPGCVRVQGADHAWLLECKHIIIATGSRPYHPDDVDFSHPRIYDSDSILGMQHTPRNMIIYGAGVIGCEYASILVGLGIRVDLINSRQHLLDFLDTEISDALSYHLREQGATIRHGEEYSAVKADAKGVTLILKSGKKLRTDALLWSNGRTGNTDSLGLEHVGLEANSRGQLDVNQRYETRVPGIYAVGDVIGWPSLASASYDQGRFCTGMVCGETPHFVSDVPTGIYTIPGISCVGSTERELTDRQIPYEVGQAFFRNLARAQITGERVGMLKLLFHRKTLALLGIHCFGYQAMEIIHVGQAIMQQPEPNNSIEYFVNTTFNYPTMAEAYRVAAINGLNRISR